MRRYYGLLILILIAAFAIALAQTPAKPQGAKPSGTHAAGTSTLPSRATVDSFLKHMFSVDPSVSWTVTGIKPSPAAGIAEIRVEIKTPQKNVEQKIFVLSGHKQAVIGEMVPFPGEPGAPRPTDNAINNFLRQVTGGANPGITWTIAGVKPNGLGSLTEVTVVVTAPQGRGAVQFLVTPDNKNALRGEVTPFGADPFAADRAKLERGVTGPARGPANAALTVVEFADLECPACKAANPIIERLVSDEPRARFVFQQFPLTQVHKWAFKAAQFGDCVYREDPAAFWKFLDQVYGAQEQITNDTGNTEDAGKKAEPKLTQLATASGANGQKIAACADQPATADRVNKSVELGKEMQITGTPTLFLNGRRISNLGQLSYEQLKRLADFMAKN
jgi:protein-disulfide isomerase